MYKKRRFSFQTLFLMARYTAPINDDFLQNQQLPVKGVDV
jgi:hypothetical protein